MYLPCHPGSKAASLLIHRRAGGSVLTGGGDSGSEEEEDDDWRPINMIAADMRARECVDVCLCPGTTYRRESLDAVRRVLGLSDLCRAKDAFEAG